MPPSARDYLKKNGDQTITSMRIERIPLGKLQKSLTAIVYVRELLTKFKKPDNIPQDDLFHLQVILTLSNGRRVMWGKEEVIKLSETIYKGDKMESRELGKTNINLQDFVDKTAKYMGDKFAPYNAFNNNCQDFIMASLKSNGLGTKADYDFVKQDTKDLFKGRQWLINMMKGATDLAAAFNVLIEGKGMEGGMLPARKKRYMDLDDAHRGKIRATAQKIYMFEQRNPTKSARSFKERLEEINARFTEIFLTFSANANQALLDISLGSALAVLQQLNVDIAEAYN